MKPSNIVIHSGTTFLVGCMASMLLAPEPDALGVLRRPIPEKPVVRTFDDGFASNATCVDPVLKKMEFGEPFYTGASRWWSSAARYWLGV